MKKTKRLMLMLMLICTLFVLIDSKVQASTPDAYMIVANPGEDSSYEMNIGWHTDLQYKNSYIIYTTKDDINWDNKIKVFGTYEQVDVFNGISSKDSTGKDIVEEAVFLDYSVTLTNLQPHTEYMYRVGQEVLSDVQYFKTAGEVSFSFAWISDFHAYAPLPARLSSAMNMIKTLDAYNNGFDFIFSTGDEIAWGGSYSHWADLFNEDYHKNYMWASVIGNHDYMDKTSKKSCNDFFRTVYNFPTNGYEGEEGVCYYFKYGSTLFITMNNETQKNATNVKKAQDWFEKVVTENPAQYIVVAQHYQWFEGINGKFNDASGYGRWKELFDKYKVDLAMAGNNHIYVRSKLLYQDEISNDYNYGTTYIQASSSDNERGQTLKDLTSNQNVIAHRFSEGGKTMGGIIVNVNSEEMKIELLKRDGSLEDSVIIKSRREVNPMDGFNKENFESNINFMQTNINNKGILSFDYSGIGYVDKIILKSDNQEILNKKIRKAYDLTITLNDLEKYESKDIDIEIIYKNKTYKVIKYKLKPISIEGKLSNFNVNIVNEGYKVTFDNSFTSLDEIQFYLNDKLITSKPGNTKEVIIENEKCSFTDLIKIVAIKDDVKIYWNEINYCSSVDLNCDGKEDKDDVIYLQNIICGKEEANENALTYLDINNDGSLDVTDATYLSMYLDKKIDSPMLKQFTVKFINADGKVIKTMVVDAGSNINIENPEFENRIFVSWNQDITNITRDLEVKALYVEE